MDELNIPINQTTWVKTQVIKMSDAGPIEDHIWRYEIMLPDFLSTWDVFANWEKERFLNMEANLNKGDVLFDIGAENGWQSAVYAKFVGPENMVLIEPSPEYWPNLKETWKANEYLDPVGHFVGLVSDVTKDVSEVNKGPWPIEADGEYLRKGLTYRYIYNSTQVSPQIKIDDYVKETGIVPTALTMDCEGAELLILKGAEKTLRDNRPLVWASVHPDLMKKNYKQLKSELFDFMHDLGYHNKFLAVDHEEHYVFWPKEKQIND